MLQIIWLVDGGHMAVPHFSDIARWIASFWISDVSDVGDVEDVRKWRRLYGEYGANRTTGRQKVGRTSMRWTSFRTKRLTPGFRRVVSRRPRVLGKFCCWAPCWVPCPQRESCTRKPLRWHIDRGFSVICRPIVQLLSSISSNPTGFSKVRGKHECLLSLFILFTCALCVCFELICTLYIVFISIWREIYTCMCLKCSLSTSTVYLGMTMEMKHQGYAVIDIQKCRPPPTHMWSWPCEVESLYEFSISSYSATVLQYKVKIISLINKLKNTKFYFGLMYWSCDNFSVDGGINFCTQNHILNFK